MKPIFTLVVALGVIAPSIGATAAPIATFPMQQVAQERGDAATISKLYQDVRYRHHYHHHHYRRHYHHYHHHHL